jgi:hypothetical protein
VPKIPKTTGTPPAEATDARAPKSATSKTTKATLTFKGLALTFAGRTLTIELPNG